MKKEKQVNELIKLTGKLIEDWCRTHDNNQKLWLEIKDVIFWGLLWIMVSQLIIITKLFLK